MQPTDTKQGAARFEMCERCNAQQAAPEDGLCGKCRAEEAAEREDEENQSEAKGLCSIQRDLELERIIGGLS